jgi:hypothetical protein
VHAISWPNFEIRPRDLESGQLDIDMKGFIFQIPCIVIHLLLCKPTKCTHFVRITIMFNSMFRAALALHRGVYSCVKQSLNRYIIPVYRRTAESSSLRDLY